MTATIIVRPGGEAVLPLAPEMLRNEDQSEELSKGNYEKQRQDCERKAAVDNLLRINREKGQNNQSPVSGMFGRKRLEIRRGFSFGYPPFRLGFF
jgi:hypothetical protein